MAYTRRHWVDYPDTSTPIDADALNNIEDGIEESHNIQLLAVTDTAPSECAEGDKYFDTTTKLIYTATDTDEWGETGETPIADILYIVLDEQSTYTYDGTDLVSVGGGNGGEVLPVGSEIDYDGTTVPTGWEEMTDYDSGWIEPTLNSEFENYTSDVANRVKYRKVGNVVTIMGGVKALSELAANAQTVIFTLPEGFRPLGNVDAVMQGSGINRWLLAVNPTGNVTVARYGTTTQIAIPVGAWLPFYATFIVA